MTDNSNTTVHNSLITEQFTRQAIPFANLHTRDDSVQLMIQAAGLSPADTVLDVACGPGLVACAFAGIAARVTGIDLTPAMIEQAQQRQHAGTLQNLDWRIGDVTSLPFPDAAFSVVVTRYALHHLLNPARAIAEMARVCTPNGRVVITDVFTTSDQQAQAYDAVEKIRDPSHVHALRLDELHHDVSAAGIQQIQTQFFRFGVVVDNLLAATRTPADHAAQFREIIAADVRNSILGIDAHGTGETLAFSFPIVIITGRKSS